MGGLAVLGREEQSGVRTIGQGRQGLQASVCLRFTQAGALADVQSPLGLRGPFVRDALPTYYLRNVTAGIFAGDSYRVDVTAASGARVRVGATSATMVHEMPRGSAVTDVVLHAEPGSTLVWGPHTTILQAGSDLRQSLDVTLAPDARVVLAEVLVLGRLARGEYCAFNRFESGLSVSDGCRTLFEERYLLTPGPSLTEALAGFGAVVSIYGLGVSDGMARERLIEAIAAGGYRAGVTALPNDAGLLVRGLASSPSEGSRLAEDCLKALGAWGTKRRPDSSWPDGPSTHPDLTGGVLP